MNKEAAALWIEALESGECAQAPGPMRTQEGYDVLGVLVEAYRKKFGGEWLPATNRCKQLPDNPRQEFSFLNCVWLPPDEVLRWLSLQCKCPDSNHELPGCEPAGILRLASGKTFPEAAKEVRRMAGIPSPSASGRIPCAQGRCLSPSAS